MRDFQFPPPPPPPPKSSSSEVRNEHAAPQRGRGRGRGRGGLDGAGRHSRGGSHQSENRESVQQRHNQSSSPFTTGYPVPHQTSGLSHNMSGQQSSNSFPADLPPGSYVNPAFQRPVSTHGATNSHPLSNPRNVNFSLGVDNGTNQTKSANTSSPSRTVAGQKRKLDALRGPQQHVKKAGPPTAPSIPSFGTSILPQKVPTATKQSCHTPKRPTNILGLTPQNDDPQYSSESDENDEDVDEEATFAGFGGNLTFEHDGVVVSLNTTADLAKWKEERRKMFPTKERKATKLEEKRRLSDERRRLLEEASELLRNVMTRSSHPRIATTRDQGSLLNTAQVDNTKEYAVLPTKPESELERARREFAEKNQQLELLRRRVSESQARANIAASAREHLHGAEGEAIQASNNFTNLGDPTEPTTEPKITLAPVRTGAALTEGDIRAEISSISSDSSSKVSSNFSADEYSEPPEEMTSKAPPVESGRKQALCKCFAASGHCRDGDVCRFRHELQPRAADRMAQPSRQQHNHQHSRETHLDMMGAVTKKSIHDRLVEREQDEQDQLALQVIKWLGNQRFFARQDTSL